MGDLFLNLRDVSCMFGHAVPGNNNVLENCALHSFPISAAALSGELIKGFQSP